MREQRITVVVAANAREGRERAELGDHDVIVLDVMLPGRIRIRPVRMDARARHRHADPDAHRARRGGRPRARARRRRRRLPDQAVRLSRARRARARARAPAAARSRRPSIRWRTCTWICRRAPVTRGGAPIQLTAKEFALLEFFVTAWRRGRRPRGDHGARLGRESRSVHERARGARPPAAPEDRRRLRAEADPHAARRGLPIRTVTRAGGRTRAARDRRRPPRARSAGCAFASPRGTSGPSRVVLAAARRRCSSRRSRTTCPRTSTSRCAQATTEIARAAERREQERAPPGAERSMRWRSSAFPTGSSTCSTCRDGRSRRGAAGQRDSRGSRVTRRADGHRRTRRWDAPDDLTLQAVRASDSPRGGGATIRRRGGGEP